MKRKYLLKISYSWGDEEEPIECNSYEETWAKAKELAIKEAHSFAFDHEVETILVISPYRDEIKLVYNYPSCIEYCYYNITEDIK